MPRRFGSVVVCILIASVAFADETVEVRVYYNRAAGDLQFRRTGDKDKSLPIPLSLNDLVTIEATPAHSYTPVIEVWEATEVREERIRKGKTTVNQLTDISHRKPITGQLGNQIRVMADLTLGKANSSEIHLHKRTMKIDRSDESLNFHGQVSRTPPSMSPQFGRWKPGYEPHRVPQTGTEHWYTLKITIIRR